MNPFEKNLSPLHAGLIKASVSASTKLRDVAVSTNKDPASDLILEH